MGVVGWEGVRLGRVVGWGLLRGRLLWAGVRLVGVLALELGLGPGLPVVRVRERPGGIARVRGRRIRLGRLVG